MLKEEIDLAEVDVAGIVLAFVETLLGRARSAESGETERELGESDLEACGEFLVLVSSLLELKARLLFDEEAAELAELEPEEAAEELARRLAEYRRMKEASAWLASRLEQEHDRYFRLGSGAAAAVERATDRGTGPGRARNRSARAGDAAQGGLARAHVA